MKILECEGRNRQRVEKARQKLPAWQLTKADSKKEVVEMAQKDGRTVHAVTLLDFLPPQAVTDLKQECAERQRSGSYSEVHVVKDDSGYCAVLIANRVSSGITK